VNIAVRAQWTCEWCVTGCLIWAIRQVRAYQLYSASRALLLPCCSWCREEEEEEEEEDSAVTVTRIHGSRVSDSIIALIVLIAHGALTVRRRPATRPGSLPGRVDPTHA
jgi:hypothetical protein